MPTVFLMEGNNRRSGFSDEYLVESGCSVGSTIKMTEKAFMIEEVWLIMTTKLIEGYRSLPYVKYNPQWYVMENFYGFGSHCMNHTALEMRLDANIISIKEEGDSSSVNQAYDKEVTKTEKRVQCQSLAYLRQLKGSEKFIDKWSLIILGCAAFRYTRDHTTIWINSFRAVNLHSLYMLLFKDWCNKIEHHMHASESLYLVTQSKVDEYQLLPVLWKAMVPEEKSKALSVFHSNDRIWTPSSLFLFLFNSGHRDQIACSLLGGFSKPRTAATQSLDSDLCSMFI